MPQKYHSIAAKGEDVEEILKAFQAQQAQRYALFSNATIVLTDINDSNITAADIDHSMAAEDDEDYEPEVPKDADATFAGPTESVLAPNGSQSANGIANRTPQARPGGPSFPQALAGSGKYSSAHLKPVYC